MTESGQTTADINSQEMSPLVSPWLPADVREVAAALAETKYIADTKILHAVFLGAHLAKPILIEGPAGTGKTELAKSVALSAHARLIRLQCYEGLDESKALYEWNYRKQLLRLQVAIDSHVDGNWRAAENEIFSREFLLVRPLLDAITADDRVVLLIDEVDRLEAETEALLLEVLSEYQISVPELGSISARQIPQVFLTSNGTRELSEALKRRCLYLHIGYPTADQEEQIIAARVAGISAELRRQLVAAVQALRTLDLKKRPSVSETQDWARTLLLLGRTELDDTTVRETLTVLLKNQSDIALAENELLRSPTRLGVG